MNKWIGISLGTLLGVSHIGMIGLLANRSSKMPTLNLPGSEYTSYKAKVSMDGYEIEYKANDPKTVNRIREVKKKGGFLGLGNNRESIIEQVPVDQSLRSQASPDSWEHRWIDITALTTWWCCVLLFVYVPRWIKTF